MFDALRAKTYVINNEPDGTNINTNCGSTHIEVLQRFVVEKGLDVGFAYDGDADRCIAVDHRGNIIDGDKITVGTPVVEGAKVDASVVKNGKGKKIRIFKYTPKKGYRKRQGHRQPYTKVEIGKISF